MKTTAAVLLARRPQHTFVAEDLTLGEIELPEMTAGHALVRNQYMSLDPSTRGRMDPGEKQYTTNFSIGGPLDGSAIGVVIESASEKLPVGATVRITTRAIDKFIKRERRYVRHEVHVTDVGDGRLYLRETRDILSL